LVIALSAAVLVIAILALSARLFVWPTRAHLERADAVIVLGGSPNRTPKGFQLVSQGYAPTLVLSVAYPNYCPHGRGAFQVICFRPSPLSTQGEARAIAKLALAHHWTSLIVVSSIPQISRAKLRVSRCFSGRIAMVGVAPQSLTSWVTDVAYEWAAYAKATLWQRSC
jgi:hypothetical protein